MTSTICPSCRSGFGPARIFRFSHLLIAARISCTSLILKASVAFVKFVRHAVVFFLLRGHGVVASLVCGTGHHGWDTASSCVRAAAVVPGLDVVHHRVRTCIRVGQARW